MRGKKVIYEFIEQANEIHQNRYNYSKSIYVNNRTKLVIICQTHGDFLQRPSDHLRGQGCPKCAKKHKPTIEEFIERANEIHCNKYNYNKSYYATARVNVIITCQEHGDFKQTPDNHLHGQGCPRCGGSFKLTIEEFIERANEIHQNKYTYNRSIYLNGKTNLIITCLIHGDFEQTPSSHLNKGAGCPICSGNIRSNNEEFIQKARSIHGDKYIYTQVNYVSCHTKVVIICQDHGIFKQTPNDHLGGKGCSKCSKVYKPNTDEFIGRALEIHNHKYTYERVEYITAKIKVIITCPEHGEFKQTPDSHLRGNGCPRCCSGISYIASRWLDSLKIPNDLNHREVRGLITGRQFTVDGYVTETNTIYEFYGDEIHGNPNLYNQNDKCRFGGTYGEKYKYTIEREEIFKAAGFNIVAIWESDYRKKLIQEFVENQSRNMLKKAG